MRVIALTRLRQCKHFKFVHSNIQHLAKACIRPDPAAADSFPVTIVLRRRPQQIGYVQHWFQRRHFIGISIDTRWRANWATYIQWQCYWQMVLLRLVEDSDNVYATISVKLEHSSLWKVFCSYHVSPQHIDCSPHVTPCKQWRTRHNLRYPSIPACKLKSSSPTFRFASLG